MYKKAHHRSGSGQFWETLIWEQCDRPKCFEPTMFQGDSQCGRFYEGMDTVSDDTGQASGSPAGLVAPVRAFAFDLAATLFLASQSALVLALEWRSWVRSRPSFVCMFRGHW
ncbi:hypothetical protein X727_33365 [Mesorhizobium sp. L103C119B0]|nr:hypothetical protein X727_33365 [Mesorhizobium sp. L103C119B0]